MKKQLVAAVLGFAALALLAGLSVPASAEESLLKTGLYKGFVVNTSWTGPGSPTFTVELWIISSSLEEGIRGETQANGRYCTRKFPVTGTKEGSAVRLVSGGGNCKKTWLLELVGSELRGTWEGFPVTVKLVE